MSPQDAARDIFHYALEKVLPEKALRGCINVDEQADTLTVAGKAYNLNNFRKIFVVGGGKAARRTGTELVAILGDRITAGILNVYQEQANEPISDRVRLIGAGHPIPSEEGVAGARQMIELLKAADEQTLVIALISGGGSSLMALPVEEISLEDYKVVSNLLLTVPATIDEINAVRKHLDPLKGGGMRKYADRAGGFISLVLSDVPVTKTGIVDDASVISSGPTVGDDSTFKTAKDVLTRHGIWDKSPEAVRDYIEVNLDNESNETLPQDSLLLTEDRSQYVIMANNDRAMEAAGERGLQLGYAVHLIGWNTGTTSDKIRGEVAQEVENIMGVVRPYLEDGDEITFGSFSTDGVDGNSDLAGAVVDMDTLGIAADKGLSHGDYLVRYDSATFFKKLGMGIETGPTGTNVADIGLALITNPNDPDRKIALVFGGEATVNIRLPEGQRPGHGGRNTHLALLVAERLAQLNKSGSSPDRGTIKKGLVEAGISESRIEIGLAGCLGYATDVGPISLTPLAVIGARSQADVEKAVRFANDHNIPINARGAGSGLPAQSAGSGIVLDMRFLDKMKVLEDHPEGGKVVLTQSGVICTRLNNYLKEYGVFLASYPASTDMATLGGMIANNASGANSCKLGTTQHQVLDLHVVLADGTSLWTSQIDSGKQPWKRVLELIARNEGAITQHFPRVPKNSSGYNVLDIANQLTEGVPVDWTRLFAHSEGTLGIITEAKVRAVPLATQKATCIVYFTDLQEACGAIPKIYNLGPSCFDVVLTTNLELVRRTYPNLGIREEAQAMYLIEFDDLEVKKDPVDPAKRIGRVRIMEKEAAAELIRRQVDDLRRLLRTEYAETAIGFEVAEDPAQQDALWQGRRSALQVLYGYDPGKRPLTMIECVVLPRDERKLVDFIRYMEEVFSEEQVVAGTHGHAGDCNFHLYLLLNLSQRDDRKRLINVMTGITRKVAELGGSMSGEHADGRTRGLILPHVFGKELFDLFVEIKELMDPKAILHPGVKIIKSARNRDLHQAIEELVGVEEQDSQLNLARFGDYSHLFSGVCSFCSQCADICPVFSKLSDHFVARTEAAPTFKRALAAIHDRGGDLKAIEDDALFKKVFDLCLLCGQCTFKCATNGTMRDMVIKVRESRRSRIAAPAILGIISHPVLYRSMISFFGRTQDAWQNRVSRGILSSLPRRFLPTALPAQRYLPRLSKQTVKSRHPELVHLPPSEADVAYFYGCSSDLLAEPIADSLIFLAKQNGWRISLPAQRCCGEPFASQGNRDEYHRLARYNIDNLMGYRHVVVHCPSCLLAFREYAQDFGRIKDTVYEKKARELASRIIDPAGFIVRVIGPDRLKRPTREIRQKIAVHLSCHEKLGLKMSATLNYTRDLLSLIPGLEVIGMKGADECCGLAGPWGLYRNYDLARKLRQDKIANITESGTDVVTSWCSGCMVQFKDGLMEAQSKIQVRHPLELLSQAYGRDDHSNRQ